MKCHMYLLLLPVFLLVGCDSDDHWVFTTEHAGLVIETVKVDLDRSDEAIVKQLTPYVRLYDPVTGQINTDTWIARFESHESGTLVHINRYGFEQNNNGTFAIYRYTDAGEKYPEVDNYSVTSKQDEQYFETMLIGRMLENVRFAEQLTG